ncbi:MAG TPA: serine hydrolase domain-containing protein [Herpetosiphonaceae bacterium]
MPLDRWEALDALLAARIDGDTSAVAVAVTDRAGLLHASLHGWADRAARRPLGPADLFELGSAGKAWAAICLLQLAEAGRIDLRAPVEAYLPWLALPAAEPITFHHLLSHTAGLPEGPDGPSSRADALALAAQGPFAPGGDFAYSNIGYNLIGYALEDMLGASYGAIVGERIFGPLGMADSLPATGAADRSRLAAAAAPFAPCDVASGCAAVTAPDLAAYVRLLLNEGATPGGRLLSDASFALLARPVAPAWGGWYGYGLVSAALDGRRTLGHRGETAGFKSYALADLDAGLGAAVLVCGAAEPIELGEAALRHAFDH